MATFFTADLHLGHANIIAYCDRPFVVDTPIGEEPDFDAMHAAIAAAWRDAVADTDTVWVLGDVALGDRGENLKLIGALPGRKLLVPGNHDRCWAGQRKGAAKSRYIYLDAGFADIIDTPEPIILGGRHVELSHFPYSGDSRPDGDRHRQHRLTDRGAWLLCGHVHEAWRQRGRQINVGLDAWAGAPVAAETVAKLIADGPADRDILKWVRSDASPTSGATPL